MDHFVQPYGLSIAPKDSQENEASYGIYQKMGTCKPASSAMESMECSAVEWNVVDGMQCSGVEWNGVDGMQCSGAEWNGVILRTVGSFLIIF